jgi:hypothetical protein
VLHATNVGLLDSHSPHAIAQTTMRHLPQLIPCRRASVATFDIDRGIATIVALHSEHPTAIVEGTEVPLSTSGRWHRCAKARCGWCSISTRRCRRSKASAARACAR